MLERILVPLDGSTRAEAILTELRMLLARHDSEVILLRVVVPPTTMNPPVYARLLDERRTEAHAYIQRVAGELVGAGATARGIVYEDFPAEAILVHGKAIQFSSEKEATKIPWGRGACTGRFIPSQ